MIKVCNFMCYPNYHCAEIFTKIDGIDRTQSVHSKNFHFLPKPVYRKGKKWDDVKSHKFSIKDLFIFLKSDVNFFWGIYHPFNVSILFILSLILGKRTVIASEGFKKENSNNLMRLLISLFPQKNLSIFAIGNNSAKDYYNLGFSRARYYKFGFFESYKNKSLDLSKYYNVDSLNILMVGQLIERKRIVELSEYLSKSKYIRKINLLIAGDGPLKERLNSLVSKVESRNVEVSYYGHCDDEQLDLLFSTAHLFCLPSVYEGWGVVVNQAINYNLPLILSKQVRSGRGYLLQNNGYEFSSFTEIVSFLNTLSPYTLTELSQASSTVNKGWNIDYATERLYEFLVNDFTNSAHNEVLFEIKPECFL